MDDRVLRRGRKVLGVTIDAEVVRLSVERIAEMEDFRRFMQNSRRTRRPGSIR